MKQPHESHCGSVRRRSMLVAALLCLSFVILAAQTATSDYTNDLPSVERVKAEIKGSSPTDTLARQVAVFTYLQVYIDRIKMNRTVRGEYTPGEQKMFGAYRLAAYQISQEYTKTHTPVEAQAFERLYGSYGMNDSFYQDWSTRLIGPQSAAAYKQAEAGLMGGSRVRVKDPQPAVAAGAQQSSDLQTNTPYQCPSGLTLTVFECQKQQGQEYCLIKAEGNGKFILQAPAPRSAAVTQVKTCKPGTPFNPPYIAEFPSADRVVQGMVVGNPHDNIVRAVGAFYQLSEIINVLAGQNGPRSYTPDEQKLLDDYSRIQLKLAQAGVQQFPGQKFDISANPYRVSRTDPKFGFEGIPLWTTFLSPNIQAQFARTVGGNDARYLAAVEVEKRTAMQQVEAALRAQNMPKDKGTVAMRHCMESGRGEMECLGEGMKVGLADLAGGDLLESLPLPGREPGLRLTGTYSAGNFGVGFDQSTVSVRCGTLVPQELPYSIERSGSQLVVKLPTRPKPLVLSYRDGKLVGPGPIVVAGEVVVGGMKDTTSTSYEAQTQTTTTQRQISASDVPNYSPDQVHQNGMEHTVNDPVTTTTMAPTTVHHYSVPTAPKTERCSAGLLPATGETAKLSTAMMELLGTQASKSANTRPGLRLHGTYSAPGGLNIEFRADSATLECGGARNAEGYAVVPEGGQLVVKFQSSTGPLSLLLQPDGTLTGSGTVEVAGRKMYQTANGDIAYTPQNARCAVGTLKAGK